MWLLISSLSFLLTLSPLGRWEIVEYFGEAVVILGVLAEYFSEFHIFKKKEQEEKRRKLVKLSTLVLLSGLAIELTGLIRTSQLSEITIARLNDEAGKAREEAGHAIERARSAEENTETLRRGNLVLQADLLKLQKAREPRRLTGEQKTKIDNALNGSVRFGVMVASILLDGEGKDFGDDFESVLGKHWLVLRNVGRASSDSGVSIGILKNCTVAEALKILDRALTSAGIEHRVIEISPGDHSMSVPFDSRFVYLLIGHKP